MPKIRFSHPYNISINSQARIGKNTTIYHGVTIGSKRFGKSAGTPTIGDNTVIFPYSQIFGGVNVGCNSIIGSGSIVTCDIPDYSIVAENPARVIGKIDVSSK